VDIAELTLREGGANVFLVSVADDDGQIVHYVSLSAAEALRYARNCRLNLLEGEHDLRSPPTPRTAVRVWGLPPRPACWARHAANSRTPRTRGDQTSYTTNIAR